MFPEHEGNSVVAILWALVIVSIPAGLMVLHHSLGGIRAADVEAGIYYQRADGDARRYMVRGDAGAYPQFVQMALLGVDGVKSVEPEPYEFVVRIGRCYVWSEVHPLVVQRLQRWVNVEFPALMQPKGESGDDAAVKPKKGAA